MRLRGLYGMIDTSASPERSHREITTALLRSGVRILQLRAKEASIEELKDLVAELHPLIRAAGAELILNDHAEIAAQTTGVGVHLGQGDMHPTEARALLGTDVLIGWSTHNLEQVREAQALPIDYIGFGPVFASAGKHRSASDTRPAMSARGVNLVAEVLARTSIPMVAIGGVNEENLSALLNVGVESAAAIGAITRAPDMMSAARDIHGRLLRGSKP